MKIDFVIPWVDGSDPLWRKEYNKYRRDDPEDFSRFRDWDILRYWFRAVEKYAPWVNQIFFITCGHIPNWLNIEHPKIKIVTHKDYIPKEYLPTFSSHTIELNLHRIEDLSEYFVYFNDDTFLNAPTTPEDFFYADLPCNCAVLEPLMPVDPFDSYYHILMNNMAFLNAHFSKHEVLKRNFKKWYHPVFGKYLLKNIYFTPGSLFSGLRNLHIPTSMCKSTYQKVWNTESDLLNKTCLHRFRCNEDVNQNIMTYYDICSGHFSPRSAEFGKCYGIGRDNDSLFNDIRLSKHKLICINDHPYVQDFEKEKSALIRALDEKYSKKSTYER